VTNHSASIRIGREVLKVIEQLAKGRMTLVLVTMNDLPHVAPSRLMPKASLEQAILKASSITETDELNNLWEPCFVFYF